VQHGSAWPGPQLVWRCVEFAQEAISGLAFLELAGVNSGQPPQVYDWGAGAMTVCQINGEPRQVPDRCFGPTSGPNWSDWQATTAGWAPRSMGVTGYSVHDGDLEGWTYATGYGSRPPSITFAQVCPPAAPAAAPSIRTTTQASRAGSAAGPVTATRLTPSSPASASAAASLVAFLPSLSPTGAAANAAATRQSIPAGRGSPPTLPLLAATVAVLSALFVWNLRRRGS